MRKITFGGASSLDNHFARPDHAVDWLMWSDEAAEIMSRYWRTIDTVLMGRKTYEAAARIGQSGAYPGVQCFVFSRTLSALPAPGATLVREDVVDFTRRLKQQEGKDICLMGGGELARPLFEADLIDEVGFNIHPVLLGTGIPVFHAMERQIDLELLECRAFRNGCVYVQYRVKHSA